MTRRSNIIIGSLVALVLAAFAWWHLFRLTPEQRAEATAADAILSQDGEEDEALGDLGADMKELGLDSDDEAEADQILDDLLAE